jgi:hypothetical protein
MDGGLAGGLAGMYGWMVDGLLNNDGWMDGRMDLLMVT